MPTNGPATDHGGDRRLELRFDRSSPVPVYHQLAEQLDRAIRDGMLLPGEAIETEASLARRLDLSRPTVRHAITELVARGLLVRRRGVGTTVSPGSEPEAAGTISLFDELALQGRNPTTKVLRLVYGEIDEQKAACLKLDPRTPLLSLERLRLANGAPIAILRNWLPLDLPDLAASHLESNGLYELLSRRGVVPTATHQTISSRASTNQERRLLELGRSDSILAVSLVTDDSHGIPIDYGEHVYRADRYQFRVSRHAA